jgi:hypothetical protein
MTIDQGTGKPAVDTPTQGTKATLAAVEEIKELFGLAHDLIHSGSHPGHMADRVARVIAFLKFQYGDFKQRAENLAKQVEAEAKAELNKVDVEAAKLATEAVLTAETPAQAPTQSR